MSNENLTAEEKRNMERLKGWAKAYETDAARFADEYYADSTEVYSALQNFYWARQGQSKEAFRTMEIEFSKQLQSRKITFINIVARGDTVAAEMEASYPNLEGQTTNALFSVFFKFDKDGKIVSDHTFDAAPRPSKGDAFWQWLSPEQRPIWEKLVEDNS